MFDAINFIVQLLGIHLGIISFTLLFLVGWKFHLKQFIFAPMFLLPSFISCFVNFTSDFLLIFNLVESVTPYLYIKYFLSNFLAFIFIPLSTYIIIDGKIHLRKIIPFIAIDLIFVISEILEAFTAMNNLEYIYIALNFGFGIWIIYYIFKHVNKTSIRVLKNFLLFFCWFNLFALLISLILNFLLFFCWFNLFALLISLILNFLPLSINRVFFDAVYFIPICSAALLASAIYFFKPANIEILSVSNRVVELYGITEREREVIDHLLKGYTAKEISNMIFLSHQVVKNYLSKIYKKVDVKNKMELISFIRQDKYPI